MVPLIINRVQTSETKQAITYGDKVFVISRTYPYQNWC